MYNNFLSSKDYTELMTLRDWVRWGTSALNDAQVCFGHGTDNALDESLLLVLSALNLDHDLPDSYLDTRLISTEKNRIAQFFERRLTDQVPAAYITEQARFCGLTFYVNENVLVPRSPIAELIQYGFEPWLVQEPVLNILDLCTGSGCIGIACAYAFEDAQVDLGELSSAAVLVAQTNIDLHELDDRVSVIESDLFKNIPENKKYDLIVSNPPYVSIKEMKTLPAEYLNEPEMGLVAGDDGMDIVKQILVQARNYLNDDGLLVVEVGDSLGLLMDKYPDVDFLWPEFKMGGHGVFVLTAMQLDEYQTIFEEAI